MIKYRGTFAKNPLRDAIIGGGCRGFKLIHDIKDINRVDDELWAAICLYSSLCQNRVKGRTSYYCSDNLLRNANAINDADYEGKANCITFFAGVKSADEMGKLKPEKLGEPKRVVLVSLRGINLTTKVEQNGEAISVSRAYTTDHVSKVVDSILSSFRSHNFVYV
ncbi:hypothetical protein Y032_0193g1407 [Ancylostoma ceylanicum]|uniref:Uncharacterized protein n=1 Tax=Ancylostoma ceylanicum TaxID=53326 RepID=A0A016SPM1_9BILA|nr:hypothetical protein Y032_0193g1407 [Ancylostoma ceylanicum]